MNKIIIAALLCVAGLTPATAQTPYAVNPTEIQIEDIQNILEMNGIYASRFDLSRFSDTPRQVEVFIREYRNNKTTGKERTFKLGRNIHFLNDYPEENHESLCQEHHLTAEKNHWEAIRELSVYIQHTDRTDSTAHIRVASTHAGSFGFRFSLQPVDGANRYVYATRPFATRFVADADRLEIPLILYGSAWAEPGTTFYRFCGESEIAPDMKADILKDIPHYYIIGVRLTKEKAD